MGRADQGAVRSRHWIELDECGIGGPIEVALPAPRKRKGKQEVGLAPIPVINGNKPISSAAHFPALQIYKVERAVLE